MPLVDDHAGEVRTVLEERGTRVVVTDSIAFASAALAGHLVVTGSHGGTSAGEYARRIGATAVACNDAGIGKDGAGVAGLAALDPAEVIGVAVGHDTARIGDGTDTWRSGIVSYANAAALAAGVRPGVPLHVAFAAVAAQLAARGTRVAPARGVARVLPREIVREHGGRRVVLLDSMSQVEHSDRGHVVVAASNGGVESGRVAALCGCAAAIVNDAGGGKDGAGVAGLAILDEAGVPGAAVGHLSARISDARDTWEHGVLTHVNAAARRAGLAVGDTVPHAVARLLEAVAA
jgi:hypothetical protein